MKRSLRLLPALALLLCLLSACGAGLRTAESPSPAVTAAAASAAPAPTPEPTAPPTPAPTPTPPPVTLGETEDMGQDYLDAIVFYGDSNTNGLRLLELLPGGYGTDQIWTPMSGTLTLSNQSIATIVYPETGEEITIAEAVKRAQPEYLVITLGVNGVSFMNEESFTKEYTDLVQTVQKQSPNTKIILNSIYPVASNYDKLESINNEKISAANQWIRAIAQATGTRFCNSAPTITGSDGFMDPDCGNGDGLHLSSAGFLKILQYMRTHAYL